MIKHKAIFTTLIMIIILITFFVNVEENSGETVVTIPNEEIPLAKIDVGTIFSTQNTSIDSSSDVALGGFLNRTFIILAILFVLWSLCIYLAARLNIFFGQEVKKENGNKGKQTKT